jgi:hypothetical protein
MPRVQMKRSTRLVLFLLLLYIIGMLTLIFLSFMQKIH